RFAAMRHWGMPETVSWSVTERTVTPAAAASASRKSGERSPSLWTVWECRSITRETLQVDGPEGRWLSPENAARPASQPQDRLRAARDDPPGRGSGGQDLVAAGPFRHASPSP